MFEKDYLCYININFPCNLMLNRNILFMILTFEILPEFVYLFLYTLFVYISLLPFSLVFCTKVDRRLG